MPGVNDLTQQFIADTYKNLMQKPDLTKEEYYNGLGNAITVINRDAIGTVKMFYPPSGQLSDYFDTSTGVGTGDWQGWALCDGQGGTPDLRGRFIVGYGPTWSGGPTDNSYNTIGNTGGEKEHTLTVSEIPEHTHTFKAERDEGPASPDRDPYFARINPSGDPPTFAPGVGDNYRVSTKSQVDPQGQPHENRPPYYVLAYVIRVS